jgi:hypothetical protein
MIGSRGILRIVQRLRENVLLNVNAFVRSFNVVAAFVLALEKIPSNDVLGNNLQ